MNLRHEWKHRLSPADLPVLRQRLRLVAKPDPHAVGGHYQIRSLYFDTPGDKALREKLDGVNDREKFRIRCYNGDTSLIHLEKKRKRDGLGCKEKVLLTPGQVQAIAEGDLGWMVESGRPLLQELYWKMKVQGLRPRTIVDYIREPFIYAPGNVRVTLDYNLRTGLRCVDFLDPPLCHHRCPGRPGDPGGQVGRIPAGPHPGRRPDPRPPGGGFFQICRLPDV